jgi:hypothetical protein
MNRITRTLVLSAVLILLTSCSGIMNFTPERAVLQDLMATPRIWNVDPDTVQILQTLETEERTLVMISFMSKRDGRIEDCTAVFETSKKFGFWRAFGSGGGCISGPRQDGQVIEAGSGSHMSNERAFSYAYGRVLSQEVAYIDVTWEDDTVIRGEPVNNSYLVYQEGQGRIKKIEAFDILGASLFTTEYSAPLEGKL